MIPKNMDAKYNQLWAFCTLMEIYGATDGFIMLINSELSELEGISC